MNAMTALKAIVDEPAAAHPVKCTACGNPFVVGRGCGRHPQPKHGLSFRIAGCVQCGHIMHRSGRTVRDLTRREAEALGQCGVFSKIRRQVDEAIAHLRG
jgi:hypothetical protein